MAADYRILWEVKA